MRCAALDVQREAGLGVGYLVGAGRLVVAESEHLSRGAVRGPEPDVGHRIERSGRHVERRAAGQRALNGEVPVEFERRARSREPPFLRGRSVRAVEVDVGARR